MFSGEDIMLFKKILSIIVLVLISAPCALAEGPKEGDDRFGGVVLALSGGGTKGFAHIGVLQVLEEMHVPIAGIVGTSIGSVIGGLYATGMSAEDLRKIVEETNIMGLLADAGRRARPGAGDHIPIGERRQLLHSERDKDFRPIGPLGMLPAMSLYSFLSRYTGGVGTNDFMKLPIPFACIATDIATGEAVVLRDGQIASAIRASVAIPGLIDPWPIEGRLLVDGGLVENLPVETAKALFPGRPVIAVNLSGPSIAKDQSNFSGMMDVLVQMIDVMTIDKIKHNEELADLVIHPDVKEFSMLDSAGYDEIYARGISAAREAQERIAQIASAATPLPARGDVEPQVRIVRNVRVEGLNEKVSREIEKHYAKWIGAPYDPARADDAMTMLMRRDDIKTVDIDVLPSESGEPGDVDIVFTADKRAPYELMIDGYSSNFSTRRWIGANITARDLFADGDTAILDGKFGNEEWNGMLRYFTPLTGSHQWGFAISGGRESYAPYGLDEYRIDRLSARIMRYSDWLNGRLGYGIAAARTDKTYSDRTTWGPYLYYTAATLDDVIMPTRGWAVDSKVWWNSDSIWVSDSRLTAYIPTRGDLSFVMNLGLKTGKENSSGYRALLGSREELFSLARHPLYGDQAAWAHLGAQYDFTTSWWGALRGELFARYGMVMNRWTRKDDAWEAGIALSVPGQFFNARLLLVYDDDGQFTTGFSIGTPNWSGGPLP